MYLCYVCFFSKPLETSSYANGDGETYFRLFLSDRDEGWKADLDIVETPVVEIPDSIYKNEGMSLRTRGVAAAKEPAGKVTAERCLLDVIQYDNSTYWLKGTLANCLNTTSCGYIYRM